MPAYEALASFQRDFDRLTTQQQAAFLNALTKFVDDLQRGSLRAGLPVKPVRNSDGTFEMTRVPDGRAKLRYGE